VSQLNQFFLPIPKMLSYIFKRLISLVFVLLGVSFLVFAIGKVTPGDPVQMMLGNRANPEDIARLRNQLHLDDPLLVQYGKYVWAVVHGDLGRSYRGQTPVLQEILMRAPASLELGIAAFLISIFIGLPAGLVAASYHNRLLDNAIMLTALGWLSLPEFWLAIMVVIIFGVELQWIPVTGGEGLGSLIAPAFCLGIAPASVLARLTRSSVLEVLQEDYIRTARAKGLRSILINYRHILRNALIPVVTYLGLLFAGLIGGAVFIESVFARPGLGRFAILAINARDMPQIQGIVLLGAALYVVMNLVVDILYSIIDPRIHYS
jgi:peptide/nickel transport system permease protein